MNKLSIIFFAVLISGCDATPVTDEQVKVVAQRCKELNMAVKVFNGVTSQVECIPLDQVGK